MSWQLITLTASRSGFSRDRRGAPSWGCAPARPHSRRPWGLAWHLPAAAVPLWDFPAAGAPQPGRRPLGEAGPAGRGPGRPGSGGGCREDPGGPTRAPPAGPGAQGPPPGPSLGQRPCPQTPALLEAQGPPQAETEDPAGGPGRRLQGRGPVTGPVHWEAPSGASRHPRCGAPGAWLQPSPAASLLGLQRPRCADCTSPPRAPRGPPEPPSPFTAGCPAPPSGCSSGHCRGRTTGCGGCPTQDPKVAQRSKWPAGGAPESP